MLRRRSPYIAGVWRKRKDGRYHSDHFRFPPSTVMSESTTTTTDDRDLVATTAALDLEEKEVGAKPRAPFGSR